MWRTARATSFVGGVSAHQIFTCKSDFHLANEFDCVFEHMGVAQKIKNLYEKKDGAIKSINDSVLVQALKYLNNIRNIIWDIKAISAYYIT